MQKLKQYKKDSFGGNIFEALMHFAEVYIKDFLLYLSEDIKEFIDFDKGIIYWDKAKENNIWAAGRAHQFYKTNKRRLELFLNKVSRMYGLEKNDIWMMGFIITKKHLGK